MSNYDAKKLKALFLDMDGVIWSGKDPIGNLSDLFRKIETLGLIPLFGTNNASRTPDEYVNRLKGYEVNIQIDQVFSSALGAVYELKKRCPDKHKIYAIGSDDFKNFLRSNGFTLVESGADAVLTSLDRDLTYQKLAAAMQNINNGAAFFATNDDKTIPFGDHFEPGAGMIAAALQICTGEKPYVFGKPNTVMIDMARKRFNLLPEEVLAVGDRYDTDIMGGINDHAQTALVLSGIETIDSIRERDPQPDIICSNLTELVDRLAEDRK